MTPLDRLLALGLSLPPPPAPKGNYLPWLRQGDLLFLAGTLPVDLEGNLILSGVVGRDLDIEQAQQAARQCALNALGIIEAAVGLNNVAHITSLTGFVQGVPEFSQSPAVLNGASDLLVEVLGEAGKHTRAAVSVSGLPLNAPVEIQLTAAVR